LKIEKSKMSEHFKHDTSSAPPPVEPDVAALIKKMQQQLGFLEKKVDILIRQSSERPFKGRPFSAPFRPFGHSYGHSKGEPHNRSRESSFAQGQSLNKQPGNENREFGQRKKPFFRQRKDGG